MTYVQPWLETEASGRDRGRASGSRRPWLSLGPVLEKNYLRFKIISRERERWIVKGISLTGSEVCWEGGR